MTFGQLPISARFVMADSPGGAIKVKTGYDRWKWEWHTGFVPVAIGCRADREVITVDESDSDTSSLPAGSCPE
jgi:hypothetical protein